MKKILNYFSKFEITLYLSSVAVIVASFCVFDRANVITLIASLVGVTSLIFNAKGNPVGQCLMIVFSLLYGVISFRLSYYGEMLTYLGMTLPMAIVALVSWLKNPYEGNRSQVQISSLRKADHVFMWLSAIVVTAVFYFVLAFFNTANILPSTLSVTTSYVAVYLTFKRSPYYALAYAANDVVLIVLWILAGIADVKYLSVVFCFLAFLANDLYGFVNWRKMRDKQSAENR